MIKAGCLWALLAWSVYALSADALSSQYTRYLLFYLIVLLDRASAIAQEAAPWYDADHVIESDLVATDTPGPDHAIESLLY